ncbi:hypothetical protein [Oligoflexus sp.]|uniref:hypothetical protein n=1 Tax=Oligoflexus sp. TaxID=1971216 RepID=UPI002D79C2C3|nr:hypothetical protein [Oligoflexus sp.]
MVTIALSATHCKPQTPDSDVKRFVSHANVNGAKLILWSVEKKDSSGKIVLDSFGHKLRCIYYKEGPAGMTDTELMRTSQLLTPKYLSDGYLLMQLQRQKLAALKGYVTGSISVPGKCSLEVLMKADFSPCITNLLEVKRKAVDFASAEEAQILIMQGKLMMGTQYPVVEPILRQAVLATKASAFQGFSGVCPKVSTLIR